MSTPPPSDEGDKTDQVEPEKTPEMLLSEADWPAPRGKKSRRLPIPELTKIGMMITCLVLIIVMRNACAQGVVNLFNIMAPPPPPAADAGPGADSK